MTDIVARILVEWMIDGAGQQTPVPTYESGSLRECARIFRNKPGLRSWKAQGSDPKIETFLDKLCASRKIEESSHRP